MFRPNSGMSKPTPADEQARALRRARVLLARNENNARGRRCPTVRSRKPTDVPGVTRAGTPAGADSRARSKWPRGRGPVAASTLRRPPAVNRPIQFQCRRTALARSEVLFRLRRYEETLSDSRPTGREVRRRRAARIRVDGRAAGGAGSDRRSVNRRRGALAGAGGRAARPLRCAVRFGRVADYESRPDVRL